MKPVMFALPVLAVLSACGGSYPTVAVPGLEKPKISVLFSFPEGSTCQVATSQGVLVQPTIPGAIDFSGTDRNARASCTLPGGKTVRVTAHNFVPENSTIAGLTVYPDGSAFITASTPDRGLVQLQLNDTVK